MCVNQPQSASVDKAKGGSMTKQTVILLHGFASSGNSGKAQFLREKFKTLPRVDFHAFDFNPTPTDFEYMTITGMINRLRQYLVDRPQERLVLVGSSMGALVGLNYAHRFDGVSRLLLLAPALSYFGDAGHADTKVFHFAFNTEILLRADFGRDGVLYAQPVPPPAPLTIIHGRHDDVVPIANSRRYAAQYPDQVQLVDVDSGHRLSDQMDLIWEHLRTALETVGT
jgi:pimeloyl-ACP methyl ester carboxylesterase